MHAVLFTFMQNTYGISSLCFPDFQDYCGDADGNFPLYGHSLSWANDKPNKVGANGRLVAKLWVPESADPSTLQDSYDCDALPL